MGHFRFHKSYGGKLVRFNISKRGTSLTTGVPGFHVNTPLLGSRRRRGMMTFSLPGSGLSYRQPIGWGRKPSEAEGGTMSIIIIVFIVICVAMWLAGG